MDTRSHGDDPPGKAPSRRPFENYVKAKKQGIPVDMYPLPAGARIPKGPRISPMQVRGVLVLIAIIGGIFVYSHQASRKPEAPAVSLDGSRSPTPSPGTPVPHAGIPGVRGVQYLDPATEDHLVDWHKGILRYGDFVTVLPNARGVDYLYLILLGPRDTFRLVRIYPPSLTRTTCPPRKFSVKSRTAGRFQILLIGTRDDVTRKIQTLAQKANAMFGVTEDEDREARINQFMADLSAELPSGTWAYHALDPIPYRP